MTGNNSDRINAILYNLQNLKLAEASAVAVISSGIIKIHTVSVTRHRFIGDTVTIAGIGFGSTQGKSYVTFEPYIKAPILSRSNEKIITTIPDSAVTGFLTLHVDNKSDSFYCVIRGKLIDIIKTNKKIVFIFSTYVYLTNGDSFPIGLDFYNPLDTSNPDIVWKGNTFEYERIIPELTKKVKGTFSEDGTVLTYFKCEYVYSITLPKLTDKYQVYKEERGFTFVNIPFHSYYSPNQVEYNLLTSEGLKEHMSEIYKNLYCAKKDGNIEIKIDSIYWSGGYFSFIIY